METKHTQEYTERLADTHLVNISEDWSKASFIVGYMRAIQETAAPDLLEALELMVKTCNPTDVTKHKKSHGMDLGEFYVGSCSVPSDKAIHMAIDAIKKAKRE